MAFVLPPVLLIDTDNTDNGNCDTRFGAVLENDAESSGDNVFEMSGPMSLVQTVKRKDSSATLAFHFPGLN